MSSITIRPTYSWRATCRPKEPFWTSCGEDKCQRPCQIEPLRYALVPWPARVWACCHTKEHTDLTWVARDNAIGIPTRLRPGQSWVRNSVGGGARDFLFFRTSGPALGLTRPPIQGSFPRVKLPCLVMSGAVHVLPLYACMVWTRTSNFFIFLFNLI